MKESNYVKVNRNKLCRACLSSDKMLYTASEDISSAYRIFVSQVDPENPLNFCMYCGYLLQRTVNFLRQCCEANQLLMTLEVEKEVNLEVCYKLETTPVDVLDIHPLELSSKDVVKEEPADGLCDSHENNHLSMQDGPDDIQVNEIAGRLSTEGSGCKSESVKDTNDKVVESSTSTDDEIDSKPLSLRVAALIDAMDMNEGPASPEERHLHHPEGTLNQHETSLTTHSMARDAMPIDPTDITETIFNSEECHTLDTEANSGATDKFLVAANATLNDSNVGKLGHIKDKSKKHDGALAKMKKKKKLIFNANEIYKCDKCYEIFKYSSSLKIHSRVHIKDKSNTNHACDLCNTTFSKFSSLRAHRRSHNKEKPYACETCGKKFAGPEGLELHLRLHTGKDLNTCYTCGANFTRRNDYLYHLRVHTGERPHACTTCDAKFSTSGKLNIHKRIHTGEKPYTCVTCNKKFTNLGDMKSHLRVHTGEKPYICAICGGKFAYASGLKVHMRTHTGEKPYACSTCGAKFVTSYQLYRHNRIHTGEKSYACDTCGKKFAHAESLKSHQRTHTGEKPYTCGICGKTFAQLGILRQHRNTHTGERPYTCNECGTQFAMRHNLINHLRIVHSREKPYACETCDARFARPDYLKFHMRLHTGEKPFACDICQERFLRADYLKRHLRSHSKGKSHNRAKVESRRSKRTK